MQPEHAVEFQEMAAQIEQEIIDSWDMAHSLHACGGASAGCHVCQDELRFEQSITKERYYA